MGITKGTWKADVRVGCVAVYACDQVNCIAELSDKDKIFYRNGFQVYRDDGSFDHWEVNTEDVANANLIVSAVNACIKINPDNPQATADAITEMYEALKELKVLFSEDEDIRIQSKGIVSDIRAGEIFTRADAAIAKAEGK